MALEHLAQLELELRQLPGVVLVTFTTTDATDDPTTVELTLGGDAAVDVLRTQTRRLAESHLDGPVLVTIHPSVPPTAERRPGRMLRVQLLAVAHLAGERVEVFLAYRDRRAVTSCRTGDRVAVAGAVIEGLGKLGLRVPYEATSVHVLSGELGEGAMVHLRHEALRGARRGLAAGRREEEAIARAVLNGLNRFLEDGPRHDHGPGGAQVTGPQVGAAGILPAAP